MGKKYDFDYIIIGSGPAGNTVANQLAATKKFKIAIIENHDFGGNNTCVRDIPYLVGQSFIHDFYKVSQSPEIGGQNLHYNFPTIASHQTAISNMLSDNIKKRLESAGVTCISGYAYFIDEHTVIVGEQEYTAENFILATGSELSTGGIVGLGSVKCLTPDTVPKIRRLPKFVFVIGGGPTGCEIAEYFAKLGTKVIIMEQSSGLLPKEDPEAGSALQDYFTNELGIMVIANSKVVAIENDGNFKRVIFKNDGKDKAVRVDCIVLATGYTPNIDFGLENTGVRCSKNGSIMANKFFQTTARNIYAIGDCLGGNYSSAERAEYEASVLADNIIHRSKGFPDYKGFIRTVNTDPSIACVGQTEARLVRHHAKYKKSIVYLKDIPASVIGSLDYGFIKIIISRRTNHILGATIVSPNAELIAEEFAIAIRHHLTALEIASTPHISNSYNYAVKLAAKQLV